MNYFELFDIPVQLQVDKTMLDPKFIALSRQYQRDFPANQDTERLSEARTITANLNQAYKTLQDPDATIRYVLQLKELLREKEEYTLPAGFLEKVQEINRQVTNLDRLPVDSRRRTITVLQTTIHKLHTEIYEPVKKIIENYQDGITAEKELLQVKEYHYKKKYLDGIRQELAGKM